MKTYWVELPITGIVGLEIKAETKEEAIKKAFASDYTIEDIQEWEDHDHICEGNVFYGMLNSPRAQEIDGDDE